MVRQAEMGSRRRRLLPLREASQMLHVHPNTMPKWRDGGLIPITPRHHRYPHATDFLTPRVIAVGRKISGPEREGCRHL